MDRISIVAAPGTWVVRAGGAVIGESTNALELSEQGYAPVIYFPRDDLAMPFLEPGDKRTACPFKGDATYFHVADPSGIIENVAWSYETPKEGVERIAGHIAFDSGRVTVEQL